MNVKELRNDIIRSMEWAQKDSRPPRITEGSYAGEYRVQADCDRLRMFLAALSGRVADGDPQLSAALDAFRLAKPGEPLPGQAAPAPATHTTAPASSA